MQTDRMTRMERLFQVNTRAVDVPGQEAEEQELYVEGYAVRFDSPTVLFEYGGTEYKEQIDRHAFDGALMEDVIFNYNHGGKVLARTRNDTLWLTVDDTGVFVRARLDGTEEGRKLYEEIAGGTSTGCPLRSRSRRNPMTAWSICGRSRRSNGSTTSAPWTSRPMMTPALRHGVLRWRTASGRIRRRWRWTSARLR